MEAFHSLISGFAVALRPENLLFALAGCVIGTVVGVLPGIGPIAGMAILLPLTFKLDATGAIIMLSRRPSVSRWARQLAGGVTPCGASTRPSA